MTKTAAKGGGLALRIKILIGIAFMGVMGGVAVMMANMGSESESGSKPQSQKKIADATPNIPKQQAAVAPPVVTNRVYKLPDGRPSIPLSKMTREERIAWLHGARVERSLRHGWTNEFGEAKIPRTLFKNATEQALSRIFTTELGNPPPRIPNIASIDGKNLSAILDKMSVPEDGDGEYAKNVRESINAAKAELKKFVAEGGNVNEFLDHYQGELANCYAMRQDAQKAFKEMVMTTSDPVQLRECFEKVNATLTAKGIKPITVGPKILEAMGIEAIIPRRKNK